MTRLNARVTEMMLVTDRFARLDIPPADALALDNVIRLYECLWPDRPQILNPPRHAARLTAVLDHVDALVLDGYGVINVGDGPIEGIDEFLHAATTRGKPVVVLTNGASFPADRTWQKYQDWGLPLERRQILSSRDILEAGLAVLMTENPTMRFGCFGRITEPLAGDRLLVYGRDEEFWTDCDAFAFLGALDWQDADQAAFEAAMLARPRPLHVANPDVAAPQAAGRFSAEPGYWTARMIRHLARHSIAADVTWYGKPNRMAFSMAQDVMAEIAGRRIEPARLAMVGDSLHTDVLGGAAAGLQTVLVTHHGLFRGQEVGPYFDQCAFRPDWVVDTL